MTEEQIQADPVLGIATIQALIIGFISKRHPAAIEELLQDLGSFDLDEATKNHVITRLKNMV